MKTPKSELVSIVIPCRNEDAFITNCITSVLNFDLPKIIEMEVLVLDGLSEDQTVIKLRSILKKDARVKLFTNPGKIQSTAINIAVMKAKGKWILRLDAHSTYPQNYLKLCYETMLRTDADNVGGLFITQPRGDKYQAHLVQALTTHPFGVGNAGFRIGMREGKADTVPYGFYRKSVFTKIGLMDERLVRAQDYEFNRRILISGGSIWRNPEIHVIYYNQPSLFGFLKKQLILEAPYNAYMWYLAPYTFAFRHAITAVFTIGLMGGLTISHLSPLVEGVFLGIIVLYFFLGFLSAFQQSLRYRKFLHLITLPLSFFLYHFVHGAGVLYGLFTLLLGRAPVQKNAEPWPGAGRLRAWPVE
jgi:glycosyltransferase involved in cell wall biosynthesis